MNPFLDLTNCTKVQPFIIMETSKYSTSPGLSLMSQRRDRCPDIGLLQTIYLSLYPFLSAGFATLPGHFCMAFVVFSLSYSPMSADSISLICH